MEKVNNGDDTKFGTRFRGNKGERGFNNDGSNSIVSGCSLQYTSKSSCVPEKCGNGSLLYASL